MTKEQGHREWAIKRLSQVDPALVLGAPRHWVGTAQSTCGGRQQRLSLGQRARVAPLGPSQRRYGAMDRPVKVQDLVWGLVIPSNPSVSEGIAPSRPLAASQHRKDRASRPTGASRPLQLSLTAPPPVSSISPQRPRTRRTTRSPYRPPRLASKTRRSFPISGRGRCSCTAHFRFPRRPGINAILPSQRSMHLGPHRKAAQVGRCFDVCARRRARWVYQWAVGRRRMMGMRRVCGIRSMRRIWWMRE
jgi:hypothetical protein